ncbi:2-octaprenyl-6-methoxyphenyl hydroxylase [Colwellia sp. 39_35_sub15_T18]|nr:2-octaprenyl-6-methoxyphenyl hydroxylase [Colwellia sp. 39_35_sub15_T18]
MDKSKIAFDIIISGGGLSGCLMALSLAKLTKADGSLLSIAIVEVNELTQQNNTPALFDDRVLALSHGSAAYLKDMGVWQHLANDACAIEKIDISDRGHYGKARLEAQEHNVTALGYVIEMALIGKGLLTELADKTNIHWLCPDSIIDINWQPNNDTNNISIALSSGQSVETSLLLACDGANSPCRQFAGINVSDSDYHQVALIANVATENPHQNKAFERFTEFGPIAMLPLSESRGELKTEPSTKNRCSLVWTMSSEQSEHVLALNDNDLKAQLELAFGHWLGAITHIGKRDVYPLVLLQAQQQTYHRMALIGNASHTIHPIAGQGFNLGLRDVELMASLLAKQLQANRDIGSFALLNDYAKQRLLDQKQVIALTDSLVTLFANDLPPLVTGRNIALKMMNYISPLKNTLVNKLMGY